MSSPMRLAGLRKELKKHGSKEKARLLQRFFKTGPGEYAEGDVFLGLTVPLLRQLEKKFRGLPLKDIIKLLRSPIHEERMLALFMLIRRYYEEDDRGKEKIYRLYLAHTEYINNWDLVDVTAKHIVGDFLMDRDKAPLYALAKSRSVWERRIAVLATFHFIAHGEFTDFLRIAAILIPDKHDLIHKATGWMLREVGKKDLAAEEKFLQKYSSVMPRTMLRYAIERFPEAKRLAYLR